MPPPDPQQRERILRAALTILERGGEEALTVRGVAAEIDASTTGVYSYFKGRPGLLNAVLVDGFERLDARIEAAAAGVPPGRKKLLARCRAYLEFAGENPEVYRVMFSEHVTGFKRSREASDRGGESFIALRDAVSAAIDAGELGGPDRDAALIAGAIWATLHGHAVVRSLWPPETSADLPWRLDPLAAIEWLLSGASSAR